MLAVFVHIGAIGYLNLLIKSSFYRLYMYKYAVNIMSVPEIIERSQEDKSTVKYRTFVLLPVL